MQFYEFSKNPIRCFSNFCPNWLNMFHIKLTLYNVGTKQCELYDINHNATVIDKIIYQVECGQ